MLHGGAGLPWTTHDDSSPLIENWTVTAVTLLKAVTGSVLSVPSNGARPLASVVAWTGNVVDERLMVTGVNVELSGNASAGHTGRRRDGIWEAELSKERVVAVQRLIKKRWRSKYG